MQVTPHVSAEVYHTCDGELCIQLSKLSKSCVPHEMELAISGIKAVSEIHQTCQQLCEGFQDRDPSGVGNLQLKALGDHSQGYIMYPHCMMAHEQV